MFIGEFLGSLVDAGDHLAAALENDLNALLKRDLGRHAIGEGAANRVVEHGDGGSDLFVGVARSDDDNLRACEDIHRHALAPGTQPHASCKFSTSGQW